ncbi:MAG: MipA/OmpV family protein [Pseudomonadota bacterium]
MFRTMLLATCLAAPAVAQDFQLAAPELSTSTNTRDTGGPAIGFTLSGGLGAQPSYFGSGDTDYGPTGGFELNYLRLGRLEFGNPDPLFVPEGLGVTGSFRFIGERDDDDDPELEGLDDVDASLEVGVGLRYATRGYQVFGSVRYGVIGHEAFVGEVGGDIFLRPNDRWTLRAGPRILFGTDEYADTYFGVTPDEAAASVGESDFAAFDPDGGLISTGLELGAGYRINDRWGMDAAIRYERLQDDAADSPITTDDEQISASIGLTRRFTLGF